MKMISPQEIDAIAGAAAVAKLTPRVVQRVFSASGVDSEGEPAIRLTIVVDEAAMEMLADDAFLDVLVQIQHDLQNAGEERFAYVSYATEADLLDDGDPES